MLSARLLSIFAVGFASAIAISACSDDESSSVDAFAGDYCNLIMPCCSQAGLGSDPSDCRAILTWLASDSSFNEANGRACLAAMRKASSDPDFCSLDPEVLDDDGACEAVFSSSSGGNVQPGGTCSMDDDCADSAQGEGECHHYWDGEASFEVCVIVADGQVDSSPCIATRSGNMTMYSSSDAPPTLGYVCDVADGLYCHGESKKCVSLRAIGESCSYSDFCVESAYCDSSTGVCAAQLPVGSACTSSFDEACVESAYCDDTAKVCTSKLADGAACTSSSHCLSGSCNNAKCEPGTGLGLSMFCGD